METKHSCRCCLLRPPDKDLKIPYTRSGKTEIYADMLKECFEIHLTTLTSDGQCGICEVCVSRLRDATDFKLQVQRSQAELRRLQGALFVKEEEPSVKSEMSEFGVADEVPMYQDVKPAVSEDPLPGGGSEVFMDDMLNQAVKPEVPVDPLPGDGTEVFMEFVLNFENQVSSVYKQESLFEFAPITESWSRSRTVRSKGVEHESRLAKDPKKLKKEQDEENTCETCGEQFTQKTKLAIHKRIHLGERYNCQQCNIQFKFKSHLDLHNGRFHVGVRPYTCEICYKKFAKSRALYKHKQIHIEKRYRCGECDKLFSNPHSLKYHKLTHSGETPYNCDICGAKFKTKRALISHMGRHMGQMNFRCEYCSAKFWDYGSLLFHKRIHVDDSQNYSCDVCHKVFMFKDRLASHVKIHTGRKYPCEFCTAVLATSGSLKQHKLTHIGEKAYPCDYCNKQFRYKHNLTTHLHIHTGEKPHCCEICGKQFGRKDNLKTHLEIHAEGKIYSCEFCTKSYHTKEGLRQHRRTHTKGKSVTKCVRKNKTE